MNLNPVKYKDKFNPDEIGIAFHWAGRAGKIEHFSKVSPNHHSSKKIGFDPEEDHSMIPSFNRQRWILLFGGVVLILLSTQLSPWLRICQFYNVFDIHTGASVFTLFLYVIMLYIFDMGSAKNNLLEFAPKFAVDLIDLIEQNRRNSELFRVLLRLRIN